MSSGRHLENGFSFEVTDPKQKTQLNFSVFYDSGMDLFCFTVNTYDHRSVGDEHSEVRAFQSNSQTRYWISPDHARIMFNPAFWDSVKQKMSEINERREAEG